MSNNRLVFDGLAELRAALRALPSELTGEASNIINTTANGAATEIRTAYGKHVRSGRLQGGVVISRLDSAGKFSAGAIVKNTAKHAWLFENGSQARHTAIGANRGTMPPTPTFVPVIVRRRRGMYQALKDLLERKGLLTSGDA